MAITTTDAEVKRLREILSPYIRGPSTDAVLYALADGYSSYLINNVQYVNDSLYITSAQGNYLDLRLAAYQITRPPAVGLGDDVFRQIGIQVKNRKQVRDLINNLLDAIFGDQFVKATSDAASIEPYHLTDGDTLRVTYDDTTVANIQFSTSQFNNIAQATAQEVADAIVTNLSNLGLSGSAIVQNNSVGNYVQLISNTIGPASSVTVSGGSAQNTLLFPSPVGAGGNMSTQWTLSLQPGGIVRYTWTGGADPRVGYVSVGQYVNIYGGGFASSSNVGSFDIVNVQGGALGTAYFEIANPIGTSGMVVQGTDNAIQFFNPDRKTILNKSYYAAVFQSQSSVLQIFMPASTKVVRRSLVGSAHLHDNTDGPQGTTQPGPYIYDTSQPFTVGAIGTTTSQYLDGTTGQVIQVADSSNFPDSSGYLIFEYGSENQEGPVPYIARPSSNTLLISPSYTLQKRHQSGTPVTIVSKKSPIILPRDGSAYNPYITDVVSGRKYAESLISSIAATGIQIVITVLFPSDQGLGKYGTEYSEISYVWSE